MRVSDLRGMVVGLSRPVPLPGGGERPYINLDNAATTPALAPVRDAVDRFLDFYSSVHRGTGYKSLASTWAYDECRRTVARFVGAADGFHTVVFTKNTTESVNKLARRLRFGPGDRVLVSGLEHHSNDLPWRKVATVERLPVDRAGHVDLAGLTATLERLRGAAKLLAVSGASNVTGALPPIHALAVLCHQYGCRIFVDAAQLAPHRKIDMRAPDDPAHLDFLALSGHKMYAPYGAGVLVAPTTDLEAGEPDHVGGGTVDLVTTKRAWWAPPPDKEEPGTPNLLGAVALARAMRLLEDVGMEAVAEHERALTSFALKKLKALPGVELYGDTDERLSADRVGVIPFNLRGYPHALTAAVLAHEGGVGVRNGCFCAHPFIAHLLGVDEGTSARLAEQIERGDRSALPGIVRISFGVYNTPEEIEAAVEVMARVLREGPRLKYVQNKKTGEWFPEGWEHDFRRAIGIDL